MIATKKLIEQSINRTKLEVIAPITVWAGTGRRKKHLLADLNEREIQIHAARNLKTLQKVYKKYFTSSEDQSTIPNINKRREARRWRTH